jgi:hypothetical protein
MWSRPWLKWGRPPGLRPTPSSAFLYGHDIFERMILARRVALALGILTFPGGAWLSAQKTTKPLNADGKLLRDAGTVANDTLPGV